MKKLFYSMLAIATMAFAMSSCEDVPAPYDDPNANHNGGKTVDENEIISETFASNFGKFEVFTTKGISWVINYSTATGTGYTNGTNTESESYLISPEIDLSDVDQAYLTFQYIFRYANRDGEDKVLITDQYNGDPTDTDWEDITGELTEGNDWSTFYTYARQIPERFLHKAGIRVALYYSATANNSRTWEVKQLKVMKGTAPEIEPDKPDMPTDLTGEGTKEKPYTVADANRIIAALGNATSEVVYVKGKVSKIDKIEIEFGNATYFISDDGSENDQLEIYRGSYLGGEEFTKNSVFNVGDEVIVCGQLVNFHGNTPEMTQPNYIYSLNGTVKEKKDPSAVNGTPEGDGSQGSPYNVAGALTFIKTLGKDVTSNELYVKGIVVRIKEVSTSNGNATYYISDDADGTDQLYIFRAKNTGNTNYTSADEISVGDEVLLYGKLVNYMGNTPEMTQGGYIVSTTHKGPNYGTHDEPLTITEAKALKTADAAWVAGEVTGFVEGDSFSKGFTYFYSVGQTGVNTNLVISQGGNFISEEFSMPVQLPRSMRSVISLSSNPDINGKRLIIYGQIGSYLNATGILAPTYIEVRENTFDGSLGELITTVGTMPE